MTTLLELTLKRWRRNQVEGGYFGVRSISHSQPQMGHGHASIRLEGHWIQVGVLLEVRRDRQDH
ncbi:hypothetical protein PsorP6_011385 [Peronosclerospora sorghi]|uniref:Uncharacterized protein n=1 Tax=Peronosclerospora sorghi TaxID=230839 RepID=A0ACC0WIK1_9STRA|nr:hypothetical protein PsorP6_011385 [Peronosclerospora sorghi]